MMRLLRGVTDTNDPVYGDSIDVFLSPTPRATGITLAGGRVASVQTTEGDIQTRWVVPDWWGDAGYTFIGDFDRDGRSDIATGRGPEVQVKLARP